MNNSRQSCFRSFLKIIFFFLIAHASYALAPTQPKMSPVVLEALEILETYSFPLTYFRKVLPHKVRTAFLKVELECSAKERAEFLSLIDQRYPRQAGIIRGFFKTMITSDEALRLKGVRDFDPEGRDALARYFSKENKLHFLAELKQGIQAMENSKPDLQKKPFLITLSHYHPDPDSATSTTALSFLFQQLKVNQSKNVFPVLDGTRQDLDPTVEFLLMSMGIDPDHLIFYQDNYDDEGESENVELDQGISFGRYLDALEKNRNTTNLSPEKFRDRYLGVITVDHSGNMTDRRVLNYLKGVVDHHELDKEVKKKHIIDPGLQKLNEMLLEEETAPMATRAILALEGQASDPMLPKGSENSKPVNPVFFLNGDENYFYHWRLTGCCATLVDELFKANRQGKTGQNGEILYPLALQYLISTAIHMDTEWFSSERYSTDFDGEANIDLLHTLRTADENIEELIGKTKDRHLQVEMDSLSDYEMEMLIMNDSKEMILDEDGVKIKILISSIDIKSFELLSKPMVRQKLLDAMIRLSKTKKYEYVGLRFAAWPDEQLLPGKRGEQELWSYSSSLYTPSLNEAILRHLFDEKIRIAGGFYLLDHDGHINTIKFPADKPQRKQIASAVLLAIWDMISHKRNLGETTPFDLAA